MQPSQKFFKVMRITRMCAKACGADVADINYEVNGVTYLVILCITVYFIFSIYTVQLKFSENWGILLESFCMVGSVLQGISKLLTGIVFKRKFCIYWPFLMSLYVDYEVKGSDYTLILNKCISRVRWVLISVALIYIVLLISLIAFPLLTLYFTGRRLFVMHFYVPRLDPSTNFGYFSTIGMQTMCLIFGAFGNFAGDMFVLVFLSHILLFVDIFKLKTAELNDLAVESSSSKTMEKLIDVVKWHQTFSHFTDECGCLFFWINFIQITTSALSIVLTLFIIFTGDWPGSYSYLLLAFAIMYLYCGLGTFVEIANDRIVDEIYEIHWYKLEIPQQKIVRFMLMKSQSPSKVTVGGVAPLSVNTGLQVTKTVYSVFMMLLNFFS